MKKKTTKKITKKFTKRNVWDLTVGTADQQKP